MKMCADCGGCDVPVAAGPAAEQPLTVDLRVLDGVFIKSIQVHRAGTLIPQHSHKHAHATLLTAGGIKVWQDGVYEGEHVAPAILSIAAGVKHLFQATTDGTLLFCIHNVARTGEIEVADEHRLIEENV